MIDESPAESGVLERFLATVPQSLRAAVTPLVEASPIATGEARQRVGARLAHVEALAVGHDFIDVELARQVAQRCVELLERVETEDAERRRVVSAAVRYFLLDDDVEHDTTSMSGFDDDVLVLGIVEDVLAFG